jgi:hypothetical protein
MHAYLVTPPAAECPTLLDDLLADSERLYHRHVTIIQKAFHEQWLQTVRDQAGREPSVFAGESPAQIEARVRDRLSIYRQELRRRQAGLIAEEREQRAGREQGIRAYVASVRV